MNRKKDKDYYFEINKMQVTGSSRHKYFFIKKQLSLFLRFAVVIFPFLLMVSCSSKKDEIPPGILPREKMISILIDMQQAEAKIQTYNLQANDSTRNIEYGYYSNIFKKHHIKSSDFESSFKYYSKNLELLNKMYDEVITGLSKRQAESAAKEKKP